MNNAPSRVLPREALSRAGFGLIGFLEAITESLEVCGKGFAVVFNFLGRDVALPMLGLET